ncbi:MAG: hypothetical protein WCD42_02205, partial [Rhizomicrobium sp.]
TQKRGDDETRFEQFDVAFHEKLRQGYLELARRGRERYVVIPAEPAVDEVSVAIWQAVAEKFGLQ